MRIWESLLILEHGISMIAEHMGLERVHVDRALVAEGAEDGVALLVLAVHVAFHLGPAVRHVGTAGTDKHGAAPLLVTHS